MNPSDSGKLEEIENKETWDWDIDDISWLISKVKEQDREIAELRARLPGTDAPWTLKELDDARARIKELEQEVLWAADACEKSEAELVQLRKYNDKLQGLRVTDYNEGVEDGKRQAEKEKV